MILTQFVIYFSYNQFMVFDDTVELPGCDWTSVHSTQGFARRESTVNLNTLLEFGDAFVRVFLGPYLPSSSYRRVIAVPLHLTSGKAHVEGPEESGVNRTVSLEPGHYKLVAAQKPVGEENQDVDLFFEKLEAPAQESEIIIADEQLSPPAALLEDADIAGT